MCNTTCLNCYYLLPVFISQIIYQELDPEDGAVRVIDAEEAFRAVLAETDAVELHAYTPAPGLKSLRMAVARQLSEKSAAPSPRSYSAASLFSRITPFRSVSCR